MKKALLSIVCISKDNFNEIKETFSSIANSQNVDKTFFNIIHIDKSFNYERAEEIGKINLKDFNYYFLKQKSKGIFNAFNEAVKIANSKYIYFLNTGDRFYNSESLNLILKFCSKKKEYSFFYGDIYKDINGSINLKKSSKNILRCLTPLSEYFPCHQACIFNTKIHKNINYPNFLGGDEYVIRSFFMRFFSKNSCIYLPFAFSLFNCEGVSTYNEITFKLFFKRSIGYIIMFLPHRIFADLLKTFPLRLIRNNILRIIKR